MIQIESVHIEEFRGIRDLTLTMNRGSFVISGPNGSGKSGVVDAIQFALTGEIGRLKGAGTGELKLTEHGPHVEKRSYPGAAFVRLDVHIPHLGKSASITRTIKKPKGLNKCLAPSPALVERYLPCLLYFGCARLMTLDSFARASAILPNCSILTLAPGMSFRCSAIRSRTRPRMAVPT